MSGRIAGFVLWLLAALAASAQAQTVEYLHTDALGSVVAVTDANRNVIERREYEPYGSQLTPAVSNGPGYTGHVRDAATGLVYMQQRYYDAQLGRFLSVDPVTADGNTGGNFNRYWYANNNPYSVTDPDGRCGTRIKDREVPSCTTIYVNPSNGGGASSAAGQQTSSTGGRTDQRILLASLAHSVNEGEGGTADPRVLESDSAVFEDSIDAKIKAFVVRGDVDGLKGLLEAANPQQARLISSGIQRLESRAADVIAKELKGSVNREFPSHLRDQPLHEIFRMARQGDPAAQTARKLLTDSRFKKGT